MALSPGTRLGPYEITAPLGAGGMGEVYKARDTRLGRDVAIKVLPERLAAAPEVRARFEREARAVSSLNHPHICVLHDIGSQGGVDYLVMEHLEGETLAERLTRGALPADELLRYAVEIADALGKAHRSGIVHRDLKPANVMLTKSGSKLLDFGLARATSLGPVHGEMSKSPTMSRHLTAEGTIVGTFQYMAPEQLEGKEADARTDIFAFGVTLYEMATGRKAFEGTSQASLITAIMNARPRPMSEHQPLTPPALERLVGVCLARDPDDRWQSASDLRRELQWIAAGGAQARGQDPGAHAAPGAAPSSRRPRLRERLAWTVAALASAAAIVSALPGLFRQAEPPRRVVLAVDPPGDASLSTDSGPMALSPDGRRIAFVARGPEGRVLLWIRELEDFESKSLGGTDDAECPFWSPDGRRIGFFAQGKLKAIEVTGGQPEVLAPARICLGATWGADGSILFVGELSSPVLRIPAAGGEPVAVTGAVPGGGQGVYAWPSFLPDGHHFLYTLNAGFVGGQNSGVFVGSLESKAGRRLVPVLSNARYAPPGHLVYAKDGSLRAQAFDANRLVVQGEPSTLIDGVLYNPSALSYLFTISDNGLLSFIRGAGGSRQLFWTDRSGKRLEALGERGLLYSPRLSHDGKRITYDRSDATTDSGDIWVYDLERRVPNRLTYDPGNESAPVWSPDDSSILFFRNASDANDLFLVSSNGTGSAEPLVADKARKSSNDWSRDGQHVLFVAIDLEGQGLQDLWTYSVHDKKAAAWLQTPFREMQGRFSPDQRWVAYASDESGRLEVYVRGFSPPGGKWRVSTDGGSSPVWRSDGKEIFYLALDGTLMSLSVRPGPSFAAESSRSLFRTSGTLAGGITVAQYDVSADGQRFLMPLDIGDDARRSMTLVTNWLSGTGHR